MKKLADSTCIQDHYTTLLGRYGEADPRSLNWSSRDSQFLRFHVLSQIAKLDDCHILDAGCGFADLLPFLLDRFPSLRYTGMDLNPNFIQICKERYPDQEFFVGDFLDPKLQGRYDYVLSSGAFGYAIPDYREIYPQAIRNLFGLAKKGMAVNLLNSRGHARDPLYATFNPLEVHRIGMRLTRRLAIRQDYLDHDITLFLYH